MSGNASKKAHSKFKPHPIFGTNPLKPILQFFSPKKKSDESQPMPVVRQDSITLPGSYPHGPNLRKRNSTSSNDAQSSSSSQCNDERRKRRIERTKNRMAVPTPRHATSGPKASTRHSSKSSKSRSFERLDKDVLETIKPVTDLSDDDHIFVNQLEKLTWTHGYRTGLVAGRDTADRARVSAPEKIRQRDEKLAKLLEEEKEARNRLEKQKAEEKLREVTRMMEQRQRMAMIDKATQAVEDQLKQGEIRRERTRELIRVLNKSELDIMANSQAADKEYLRVELEKIASTREQLAEERAATRQQHAEVAKARAELEEIKTRLQEEEEAARAQAVQASSQFNEMMRAYHQLQQQIRLLQDEKDAAQRKSDDVLFQARMATRRIRQVHEKALRDTREESARSVAEAVILFQARLDEEALARRRAEEHAAAVTAAVEAAIAASALQSPALQDWQWQAPPPYELAPPAPPPFVPSDSDRIVLYERKWEALKGDTEVIFFQQVPWPVLIDLLHPDQLDIADIRRFITNDMHAHLPGMVGKTLRERIKLEMLRWHPDKFDARVLPKVDPAHRPAVKETAEKVVRMLTHLMRDVAA
ncbi:hypothetical protein APHAL10511_002889 [Amanita phalloides]|nr:hypothetical protein APHAL10511_002889 [Amanita phalloides]